MNTKIFFALLALLTTILLSCRDNAKKELKTETVSFKKEGELHIFKKDSVILDLAIEIADSDYETQTGLMYRESMEEKQGMLFIFPEVAVHSFYMKNTLIPLDIIFIDEEFKIASFQKNAQPLNESGLSSRVPIKFVLEVNAGLSEKWQLQEGDSIAFTRN